MCGVLGLINYSGDGRLLSKLPRMASLMRHRGPDDEGYAMFDLHGSQHQIFAGPDTPDTVKRSSLPYAPRADFSSLSREFAVGLAHRRLSIIDLTATGHQPLSDETGRYWIVLNGEIYNFKDIRAELHEQGYQFQGDSDTEVMLKAYMAWGDDCQNKFNGMWAALIWDNVEKTLWISRDRFGVKPLFYTLTPAFFGVFSEIKCLLPLTPLSPFMPEVYSYLADGPSEAQPETFFKNVFRFPPGHSASISALDGPASPVFKKYYELPPPNLGSSFSTTDLRRHAEEFSHLLKDAVRLRLFADVKVSCALSGGLDSSTITCLAHEVRVEQNSPHPLLTVSNVYSSEFARECDESHYVHLMCKAFPVVPLQKEPDGTDILAMNDRGLWHYENCYDEIPLSGLNTFELCSLHGIKVNLDGQGADEILAGYLRYWHNYFAEPTVPFGDSLLSLLLAPIPLKTKLAIKLGWTRVEDRNNFLSRKIAHNVLKEYASSRSVSVTSSNAPVNVTLRHNTTTSLQKLLRNVDFYSMFYSVESRQPYLDFRIIELLNSLPYTYKLRRGWTKYLTRIAFKNKLPNEIVWRKDKMGWPQPLKHWLRGNKNSLILKEIQESPFLAEVVGPLSEKDIHALQAAPRLYLRLYNLARQHALFF